MIEAVAERVYDQIVGFSGFGFPKSHSAAFGLLAYQSTWLRVHYGPEFLCALLNEQPMGFYPPDALVHEAQRRGLEVLPPDVNSSELDCRVETVGAAAGSEGHRRSGSGSATSTRSAEADAEAVMAERSRGGPYADVADLAGRSGASRGALVRLAWAGALDRHRGDRIGRPAGRRRDALTPLARRQAAGRAVAGRRRLRGRPGSEEGDQLALPLDGAPAPDLPELEPWERMVADYRSTGITIGTHPMEMLRAELDPAVLTSAAIGRDPRRHPVRVAGMVVARQRPATAKGIVFMLLEDEHGVINLIVPPPVVERHRLAVRTSGFVVASGQAGAPRGHHQRPRRTDRAARAHRYPDGRSEGDRAAGSPGRGAGRVRARRRPAGPAQLRAARALEPGLRDHQESHYPVRASAPSFIRMLNRHRADPRSPARQPPTY